MKLWTLTTFLSVSLLLFSGCVGTNPSPSDKPVVDETLPIVVLTQSGVVTDMKAIGFEWESIEDPRVKGIYIYKQALGKEATKYKFHNSVTSRFVTHYVDKDVEPESKYKYYFKTFTLNTESRPSQEVIAQTLPVLESVSWVHAVTNMPRSAKIIWRPHTNQIVKKYILERKTLEEDEWSELEVLDGRLTAEYIDSELKDGYVYKYRVKVLTYNDITSNPSKEVSTVTKALPAKVHSIKATQNLPKKIKLTWAATSIKDFSHYNIYRSNSVDGGYDFLVKVKNTEYLDILEEDAKNYFYSISTVDLDGLESNYSGKSVHGKTLVKPETPSLVETQMVGNNLEISWTSNDERIKSFVVTKKGSKSWFDGKSEEFLDIKGQSFVDTAVAPESTYAYQVYSVDEFGIRSEPSIEVKYTTTKNEGVIVAPKVEEKVKETTNNGNDTIKTMDLDMSGL